MTPTELRQRAVELERQVRGPDGLGPEDERGAAAYLAAFGALKDASTTADCARAHSSTRCEHTDRKARNDHKNQPERQKHETPSGGGATVADIADH